MEVAKAQNWAVEPKEKIIVLRCFVMQQLKVVTYVDCDSHIVVYFLLTNCRIILSIYEIFILATGRRSVCNCSN
jgi:hypothetical protein